tara:strand:- start:26217 stop:26954 length:738 start_codon:yes stop_codon:yes gene_type:complete
MKVIILCAGKGRRFKIRTPKCLLKIDNETLVEKCLNNFKDNYIKSKDIIFASGFKENLIKKKVGNKFNFIKNKDYENTNMVYTFFNAIKKIKNTDIIVTYSDIMFSSKDLNNLIKSKYKFTTLVDSKWKNIWKKKKKLLLDSETLKIYKNKIISLGKKTKNIKNIDGRFVGITKISSNEIKKIKLIFDENLLKYPDKFKKIDMTNFFDFLIKKKQNIYATKTHSSWYEFDDKNDLKSFKDQNFQR